MALTKLWVEVYRPKTLAEMIFANDAERAAFESIVKAKSLPNLLITGQAGTGKTSISGVLLREFNVLPEDVLRINCSDEKIEAMREKVKVFAYTMPMGAFKVVQLEEMDNLSIDAQKLLRQLIEEVSEFCRFIATGNYLNSIIPPLVERFQETHVFNTPSEADIAVRAAEILETEKINFSIEDIMTVVAAGYPSVRRVINLLERSSRSGTLIVAGEGATADWKLNFLPLLETGDFKAARKLVCESATKEELQDVYRFLYKNIHRVKKFGAKEDQAIVTIAQYQYQHQFVDDKEIQIAAMFIELGAL
jgi:DNA polymerase III delta prime subunit